MKTILLSLLAYLLTYLFVLSQDLSGTWSGGITQGESGMYTFVVKIEQKGSELSGISEIINSAKKNGVTERFRGTVNNNEINISETSVIRFKMSPAISGWCLKVLKGVLTSNKREYIIEGTWTGNKGFSPNRGYTTSTCVPGTFKITKAISWPVGPLSISRSVEKERDPILLKNVLFELQTDQLIHGSYAELDTLVLQLQNNPTLRIRLEGHTDHIQNSSAQADLLLSQKRVSKVKAYLMAKGILGRRVETKGYGHSKPLVAPPNEANRRVEFVILD